MGTIALSGSASGIGAATRDFPVPLGGFADPDQIATGIAFLLSPDGNFCCGSVLFVDRGTDAMMRLDHC